MAQPASSSNGPTLGVGLAPLAARMRATTLDEILGQSHLLAPGSPLSVLVSGPADRGSPSVILWGPSGTGKTTIAKVIAHTSDRRFVELSAVSAGVREVRQVMDEARSTRDLYGVSTVLFLDEIHRFSKAQQDALLPGVENGWVILIAATTENPSFSIITPLLSRSLVLTLHPLDDGVLAALLEAAVADPRGFDGGLTLAPEARDAIVLLASGDARRALTVLEAAGSAAALHSTADGAIPHITTDTVASVVDRALLRYDRQGDEHYDVISAFIKSVRGSDVDAALHYLARMIEAGEDPRFIARRVMILAAEDIGIADPQALVLAVAAAQGVALIGMPEGRILLAEAVVYLATAPKSNAAYVALDTAIADVRAGRIGRVPTHLRDAHYPGAARLGHGSGYRYPHDVDIGVVAQQYLPNSLVGTTYYRPSAHGYEREIVERLARLRGIIHPD